MVTLTWHTRPVNTRPVHKLHLRSGGVYVLCIWVLLQWWSEMVGTHVVTVLLWSVPFFTPNGKNSLLYTQEGMRAMQCCCFFISKYGPMSRKNGGQKWEWWYPTVCVGSYFIPDGNIQTLLLVLEATSYQTETFRHTLFVCKVATCKSTRKLISGLLSMSVYNNDGWKWA